MANANKNPRVLIVTPEVTYLPKGMGNIANCLSAKAGGLADVSASLISALFDQGGDVHVAIPDYRTIFNNHAEPILEKEFNAIRSNFPEERIHLAKDRAFFYLKHVYADSGWENIKISRIMTQSAASFNHSVTASHYIELYEKMLHRPFIN